MLPDQSTAHRTIGPLQQSKRPRGRRPDSPAPRCARAAFAIRALKAGASGYLTKETAPEELINAIRVVHSGSNYITSFIAEKIVSELQGPAEKAPHASLSSREFEVLCMIGSGKTIKEIAELLCLSDRTVSTYRTRIIQKMGFKNNAMIMHYALDNWLVI